MMHLGWSPLSLHHAHTDWAQYSGPAWAMCQMTTSKWTVLRRQMWLLSSQSLAFGAVRILQRMCFIASSLLLKCRRQEVHANIYFFVVVLHETWRMSGMKNKSDKNTHGPSFQIAINGNKCLLRQIWAAFNFYRRFWKRALNSECMCVTVKRAKTLNTFKRNHVFTCHVSYIYSICYFTVLTVVT